MPRAPLAPESLPLRDIHLPPGISWWPPAPGWWLLLLGLALLTAAIYLMRQYRRGRHFKRLALNRLDELEQAYIATADPGQLLQGLSRLLRQSAKLHFPESNCAGLVGDPWLSFLDQKLNDRAFSQGVGRQLAEGPYRPQNAATDPEALLLLCRKWLKNLPPTPKSQRRQE